MPTAAGICQKQLIKVIDDLEKVKVNEEEIADFMPEIYRKLEWLSKEDLIKRMVSHEFNRFAEYYRHRPEIEQPTSESRSERAGRGDRKEGGFEKRSRKAAPGFNRLFINLGKTDSFFPSDLIGLLNNNTRGRIELGRIDLMQNFSFFEVPEKEAINVVKALSRAKWNGRKVVVEISSEEGGKGRENGSGERKDGKRFGKGEERAPRYENKDRKSKDASAKGSKPGKKEKPSRAERGYSDARGPKKKDDWQEFFKDKEPDFSEEGWARRKPKK